MDGYINTLKKYAVFKGRADRKEYWMFTLINFALIFGLFILAPFAGSNGEPNELILSLCFVFFLAILIPTIAVSARRLHDSDKSGWWLLLLPVPLAGIIVTIFTLLKGTDGDNRFGPAPEIGPEIG